MNMPRTNLTYPQLDFQFCSGPLSTYSIPSPDTVRSPGITYLPTQQSQLPDMNAGYLLCVRQPPHDPSAGNTWRAGAVSFLWLLPLVCPSQSWDGVLSSKFSWGGGRCHRDGWELSLVRVDLAEMGQQGRVCMQTSMARPGVFFRGDFPSHLMSRRGALGASDQMPTGVSEPLDLNTIQ